MKTNKITVNSNGYGMEKALDEVEEFSKAMGFAERSARRARLLAEETMSMVRAIVDDFVAEFWMESTQKCSCELHLVAEAPLNYEKKQELIDVSTEKRNEASVGIMGKIKDFIEDSIYNVQDGASLPMSDCHFVSMGGVAMAADAYTWTLEKYRQDMENGSAEDDDMEKALDELEKSIVANIADDIRVSVSGTRIEMIIRKNF